MGELPLIDGTGLTRAQREGHACASCRKRFPRPTIPVGRLATGEILYRCPECVVELEPTSPDPGSILSMHQQSGRRP